MPKRTMRKLFLLCALGVLLTGEAKAWVELESGDGGVWDCVGDYCYKDEDGGEEREAAVQKKAGRKIYKTKVTGDPLAFPKRKAGNDPLAMPKPGEKSRDPLAF